jgi:hypothetical protein
MELTPEQKKQIDKSNQENLERIPTFLGLSALSTAGLGLVPVEINKSKIKQQEAQRLFPNAEPSIFNSDYFSRRDTIPTTQQKALNNVFGPIFSGNNNTNPGAFITNKNFVPIEQVENRVKKPSTELGSFQQYLTQQSTSLSPSIQALTVTPAPNPSRFSAESLEPAETFARFLNQQTTTPNTLTQETIKPLQEKYPSQGGYVWGNIQKPQYGYAQRVNPSTGEEMFSPNPSLYVSKFAADPARESEYLFTEEVKNMPPRKPLSTEYLEGPSWGIRGKSSSAGLADNDVSFRKDLIETRGELTTGDLQAILKEKNLPYERQVFASNQEEANIKSPELLKRNLKTLAEAEQITPFEAVKKYARNVPGIGVPSLPATEAEIVRQYNVFSEGPGLSEKGGYGSKVNLRQLGILPNFEQATYTVPGSEIEIDRDKLRPKAANKLLNSTVDKLIEQGAPIKGLGLGGIATGGIATAADPAVIDALSKGDYKAALETAAINTGTGAIFGSGIQAGLGSLQAAGYARPAAVIGSSLPAVGGVLGGLSLVETGKALNRVYRGQTGKDFPTRNQPVQPTPYTGPTPSIQPRMGKAVLNGRLVDVPYGSVAGTKTVGRPWWDKAGSTFQGLLNRFNAGSIIGR